MMPVECWSSTSCALWDLVCSLWPKRSSSTQKKSKLILLSCQLRQRKLAYGTQDSRCMISFVTGMQWSESHIADSWLWGLPKLNQQTKSLLWGKIWKKFCIDADLISETRICLKSKFDCSVANLVSQKEVLPSVNLSLLMWCSALPSQQGCSCKGTFFQNPGKRQRKCRGKADFRVGLSHTLYMQ